MVLDKGFAWNGETYGSLSQIAKAMTGTNWNGHRFFGLRTAKSDRSARAGRRGGYDDVTSADVGSRSVKESGAAHIRGNISSSRNCEYSRRSRLDTALSRRR